MVIFDVKALASGPLVITFPLGTQGKIDINVLGEARNTVAIMVYSGTILVYTGSMNQTAPNLVAPDELIIGDWMMKKATFKLTIPTENQYGSVFMTAKFKSGDNSEQEFKGIIATWTLTS